MKIAIITDDAASFTKEEASKLGITILRMPLIINGEVYFQDENIDEDTFIKKLESGEDCSTSQPSPGEVMDLWRKLLKDHDQIVHIPMSSGLSATCATASQLAQDKEFKGKVFIVDNHRIEPTLKESVRDAVSLVQSGKSAEEIQQILNTDGPNSSIYIMVNTLKYLKKGGRITPAAALLGGALHLKPVLSIFGGKLDAYAKAIGVKKAKQVMIDAVKKDLETKFKNVPKSELYFSIAYSQNLDEAKQFEKEFKEAIGIENVELNTLSCLIVTHTGPGVLACTVTKKSN